MKPLQEMYHMSSCQATLSTFTVSHISWTVCCACTLCTLEDVIYFEFLVGVTHAPVLSSSTTTLAIFAHSLIPWPPHSGLFHRFRTHQWDPWDSQWAVGFNVAIENRDIPQFRAIDRSAREPICLFMRSARLRWLAAKKPVDRRRILDSVKLRAKRSPGQGKCGYVRRVVSRGDWLQHMQNSTDNRMNRKTKFSES